MELSHPHSGEDSRGGGHYKRCTSTANASFVLEFSQYIHSTAEMEVIIDMQGFKKPGNQFILKELAISPAHADIEFSETPEKGGTANRISRN